MRALRSRRGMTRKAVAQAADVSERHLANLEYGVGNVSGFNIVDRQVLVLKPCKQVVPVALVFQNAQDTPRHLEIAGTLLLNEDRIPHIEATGSRFVVVRFFIHEYKQAVAQSVDLLTSRIVGARRLRLPDAGHLQIDVKCWEIDAGR